MLINLKEDRTASSQSTIMDRLQRRGRSLPGLPLYLRPTQDLTIDAETGPTQYRLSLEGVSQATVDSWANKLVAALHDDERVKNLVSDAANRGLSAYVDLDRDTASRLAI